METGLKKPKGGRASPCSRGVKHGEGSIQPSHKERHFENKDNQEMKLLNKEAMSTVRPRSSGPVHTRQL